MDLSKRQKEDEDVISLLDIILVLVKKWKMILIPSSAAGLLTLIYMLISKFLIPMDSPNNFCPDYFTPTVKVRMENTDNKSISSMLSGSISSLSSLSSLSGGVTLNPDAALTQELLIGNKFLDQIIEEFDLIEKYNITENPKTTSRKNLSETLLASYVPETSMLTISFTNRDKVFATTLLNKALEILEGRFRELTMEKIVSKKKFLEDRLEQISNEMEASENELLRFQQKYGVMNADVSSNGQVKDIVFANFVSRSYSQKLASEYGKMVRDIAIQNKIITTLRQQYETVKIEEMDDSKTFQVIEKAEIPEQKSGPPRLTTSIENALKVMGIAIILAFIREYLERAKKDPVEAEKLEKIKGVFRRKSHKK